MYIVFTDLDGTLLDHHTYSYEKSLKGISILKERRIPLVLISSKTFEEIKILHNDLSLESPFVFENGGGIAHLNQGKYETELTGESAENLIKCKDMISKIIDCEIKLLSEMTIEEIVNFTGLSENRAKLAMMRKASMPFILLENMEINVNDLNDINKKISQKNINITKGGRFFHCSSIDADKGNAMNRVIDLYLRKEKVEKISTVAIGDSENDISMLKLVDFPFLVRKHDNSFIKTGIENIHITDGIGPAGFTEAIEKTISIDV